MNKERELLVAVVVVAGNVDFRPDVPNREDLSFGPDLENQGAGSRTWRKTGPVAGGATRFSHFFTEALLKVEGRPSAFRGNWDKARSISMISMALF
jgi:hypothetical protein